MTITKQDLLDFTSYWYTNYDNKLTNISRQINGAVLLTLRGSKTEIYGSGRITPNYAAINTLKNTIDILNPLYEKELKINRIYEYATSDNAVYTPQEMIKTFPDIYTEFLEWKLMSIQNAY